MRKSRVRAIRAQEINNPAGMSTATFRAAKRRHSNSQNRVPQPKPFTPKGVPGHPANTVQEILTWKEIQPRRVTVEHNNWEYSKGGILKLKRSTKRTSENKRKMVTRVISFPDKKAA